MALRASSLCRAQSCSSVTYPETLSNHFKIRILGVCAMWFHALTLLEAEELLLCVSLLVSISIKSIWNHWLNFFCAAECLIEGVRMLPKIQIMTLETNSNMKWADQQVTAVSVFHQRTKGFKIHLARMPVVMLHRVRVSREQGNRKEQSAAMLHEVFCMLFSSLLARVVQGRHLCAAQRAALPSSFTQSQIRSGWMWIYIVILPLPVHHCAYKRTSHLDAPLDNDKLLFPDTQNKWFKLDCFALVWCLDYNFKKWWLIKKKKKRNIRGY